MMRKVQKRYKEPTRPLIKELSGLRKGPGIGPAKLRTCVVLKSHISRITNIPIDNLSGSQMHAYLAVEIAKIKGTRNGQALYNALGLETTDTPSLSERRAAHALLLGKHTDTVERYENQAIAEFAAHLVELSSQQTVPSQPQSISSSYLRRLENQAAMARAATTMNLAGLLSLDHRAEELVQYLEAFRQPYLDATVDLAFRPSRRGDGWYRIDVSYSFQGGFDVFRVAAVTNNSDGEYLMKLGLIQEFHKLNDTEDPAREMKAIASSSTLTLHRPDTREQKLFRFKEMPSMPAQRILQSVEQPLRGTCRLMEITIPVEWQNQNTVFEYHNTLNLREDLRYAYWFAPGMMYVKKFTLDHSEFPNADNLIFKALPFLGNITGDAMINQGHSFTIHLNNWLMPGHGVGLAWEIKSE